MNIQINETFDYPAYPDDISNQIEVCGPVSAPVSATATGGVISWYDAETGGNLLGTGSNLNFYTDRDTVIYVSASPKCMRYEVFIDIIDYPQVPNPIHDTVCMGNLMSDVRMNFENDDPFEVYLTPTGGSPYDYRNDETELTEDDTLYLEAYNDYCIASERVPFYIRIVQFDEPDVPDTTYCGEALVDFTFNTPGPGAFHWLSAQGDYITSVDNGDAFTTPTLTDTTLYKVVIEDYLNGCYSNEMEVQVNVSPLKIVRDSILSCTPLTWRNGLTYSGDVNEVVLTKSNAGACDSVYYLNLQVSDLESRYVIAGASGACIGQQVNYTVYQSQAGKSYVLVNDQTGDTLDKVMGNGSNVFLQTTPLTQNITVKVLALDSLVNPGNTVVCEKLLGTYNLVAGESISDFDIVTCDSYEWEGKVYTSSGVYRDTLLSAFGCDSILQLHLTIRHSYNNDIHVTACDSYTWQGVTYTSSGQYVKLLGFTTTGCDSTETLNLTIHSTPVADAPADVTVCGSYTLPALTVGNYFDGPGGTGTAYSAGDVLSSGMKMYVYAETGSTPNCTDENSFDITINAIPVLSSTAGGRCGTGTIDLSATAGSATINWYDQSSGGTLLGSGTSFTTPSISVTTTFYAEAIENSCSSSRQAVLATVVGSTRLIVANCGSTLTAFNDKIYANNITGASDYRFEVTLGGTTIEIDRTARYFYITQVAGYDYDKTYTVRVKAKVNGIWGCYGTSCALTTPSRPTTTISAVYCGTNLAAIDTRVFAYSVSTATAYRFRVTNGASVQTIDKTENIFRLTDLPLYNYNTTYMVDVAYKVNEVWGLYGAACDITTPGPGTTQVQASQCGTTLATTTSVDKIYANAIPLATDYRFEVTYGGNTQVIDRTARYFYITQYSGMQHNRTYSIRVASKVNGTWTAYGAACNITTPASGMMQDENIREANGDLVGDLSLEAYPNPNSGNFIVTSSHEGAFNVINELGQLMQTVNITKEGGFEARVEGLEKRGLLRNRNDQQCGDHEKSNGLEIDFMLI